MLLRVKLLDVWDAKDVMTDLFLEGISDKVSSTVTVSGAGIKSIDDIESITVEDFPPETIVDGIEFKQLDSSPVTAFKLGCIMAGYNYEVL
jgi:hypothetical protein